MQEDIGNGRLVRQGRFALERVDQCLANAREGDVSHGCHASGKRGGGTAGEVINPIDAQSAWVRQMHVRINSPR